MPNQVLVAANSFNAIESAKFRMEYRVVGSANPPQCGHFDWQPDFSHTNAELLADLIDTVQAVLLAKHTLTVLETEIITLGIPSLHSTYDTQAGTVGDLLDTQYIRKANDESVTSSIELQDDGELLFAIGANEVWEFMFYLHHLGAEAGDLKVAVLGPSGVAGAWGVTGPHDASAAGSRNSANVAVTAWDGSVSTPVGNVGAGGRTLSLVSGLARNGATPGNIKLQWAQNTSSGTATTIKADSYLIARRFA